MLPPPSERKSDFIYAKIQFEVRGASRDIGHSDDNILPARLCFVLPLLSSLPLSPPRHFFSPFNQQRGDTASGKPYSA